LYHKGEKIGPKEENLKGSQDSSFLAISTKGGEINKPKAKGPHHHHFQKVNYFTKGKKSFQLKKPS
jgi:hypothetical protein